MGKDNIIIIIIIIIIITIKNFQLAPSSLDANQSCRPGNDANYCL